jgi:phage tail sheath gpL-like
MGISGAVFESAGKRTVHWVPGVYSRRNTVPAGTGTIANNLVVMGQSVGGRPMTMIPCADITEARELLTGGQLLDAVAHAFTGSNDYVPQQVYAFRVNKGLQSLITLKNGGTNIMTVTSKDYGVHMNQLRIWVRDGTVAGSKKITLNYKGNEAEEDNILRKSISVQYIGSNGTAATMQINADGAVINVIGDTGATMNISWEDCDTLEALSARLNDTGLFVATLIDDRPNISTRNLDTTAAKEIKTAAAAFNSDLTAFAETLAAMPFIGEVEIVSSSLFVPPDSSDSFEYFSGATAGTYTVQDWVEALAALEEEEVQSIVTPSTDHDVRVLISNHITSMCQTEKKKERQGVLGLPRNTSLENAAAAAKELNSEYVSLVMDEAVSGNPLTGTEETIDSGMLACKIAGMEAAMGMAEPLTNKQIKVNAFGKKRRVSELNTMIKSGLMPCGINEDGLLVVIRAMTTYQDDNLSLNERSCVREALFMDRDLRKAYSRRTGTASEPSKDEIVATLLRKAEQWFVLGYITRADSGDLVFDIKVRFEGDKTYLTYSKYLRAPNNFTFITSNNMIYSSAEAA